MARKTRQRISYVLPLADSAGGHRLGVNGLAVDANSSTLYSGGRDGVLATWDLNLDGLANATPLEYDAKLPSPPPAPTVLRQQVQAHTHWINDIALAHSNQALVSASSDITVKVWRPAAADPLPPQTIGLHTDYVKTLAVPNPTCDWVASGGLDRYINVWDLNGGGEKLKINVTEDEVSSLLSKEKGSVYALAATNSLLASGGPESTVRVFDCRTAKRVTKLVGHTDNIRNILISQDGQTIMTASSDHTVKVWSTVAGRCMYTLTMHDASVWSLFSSDPDLNVFYSSDKNGLVAKTDTRDSSELDEGLSIALFQEHEGVHKVVGAGDCLWTATSRPSINRWRDVNTDNVEIEIPEGYDSHPHRLSTATARSRYPSPPNAKDAPPSPNRPVTGKRKIPLKHVLRLSNTAYFPAPITPPPETESHSPSQRRSTLDGSADATKLQPIRPQPEYSVEGQNGLIKHVMLNDRKRVLTTDTAGEVVMWDLLKCVPIKSFGKRHLEDVQHEVTTTATVANWCTVDTRTGSVAVTLEENTCFDAEMYADELDLDPGYEYKEDQRINLGKWVLRYLFDNLINEEIKRDEAYRKQLLATKEPPRTQRENAPSSIELPPAQLNGWHSSTTGPPSATTLKPGTNGARAVTTPGFNIALATPGVLSSPSLSKSGPLSTGTEEVEQRRSSQSQRRSNEKPDYFSTTRQANAEITTPAAVSQPAITPGVDQQEPQTPSGDTPSKDNSTPGKGGLFGKKFSMPTFTGMKKLGRVGTNSEKPAIVEEKEAETESDSRSSKTSNSNSRVVEENLLGTIQKIRYEYEDSLASQLQHLQSHENGLPGTKKDVEINSLIEPLSENEVPRLSPPPNTTIVIQEERAEAGGVADLFEGTVGALGEVADLVEKAAPMWVGEVLLKGVIASSKDPIKISFILEPYAPPGGKPLLPSIASDGNNRLNANRMLRAKKVQAYIAERIEPAQQQQPPNSTPSPSSKDGTKDGERDGLKPEEYLELLCQGRVVNPSMTLASIRAHLWRGGGDVVLLYRGNGRRKIGYAKQVRDVKEERNVDGTSAGGGGGAAAAAAGGGGNGKAEEKKKDGSTAVGSG